MILRTNFQGPNLTIEVRMGLQPTDPLVGWPNSVVCLHISSRRNQNNLSLCVSQEMRYCLFVRA